MQDLLQLQKVYQVDWNTGTLSAEVAATSSLLSITSPGTQYIVTMTMKGTDRIDVIVNDGRRKCR